MPARLGCMDVFMLVLQECYDLIDPEKEIVSAQRLNRKETLDKELELLQRISKVLDQGKFIEIPVNAILGQYNTNRGIVLTANPADYEILRVWARGLNEESSKPLPFYKRAYHYIWQSELQHFVHVVTAVRQKSGKKLWLKVYNHTPKEELISLLPAGVMKMNNLNQWLLKIAVVSGVSSTGIMLLYQSQYLQAALFSSLLMGGWSLASYLYGRNKFLRRVAGIQYHHCVASNWGAIALAVDIAQQSTAKGVLLAYLFLLAPPNRPNDPKATFSSKQPKYHTESDLKSAIEEWLDQNFNCSVNFNSKVAVSKLDELGLLVCRSDGTLSVLSMDDAIELLPKPPLPWETKMPQDNLIESELTQTHSTLLQWK